MIILVTSKRIRFSASLRLNPPLPPPSYKVIQQIAKRAKEEVLLSLSSRLKWRSNSKPKLLPLIGDFNQYWCMTYSSRMKIVMTVLGGK